MKLKWLPIRSFFKRFYWLFRPLENKYIRKYKASTDYFPVFIIGVPRSGSTILYQLLSNYLLITYPSNIVELMKETPFLGFLMHDIFFDSRPHNNFYSQYGNTDKLYAPVEGTFWYNWLDKTKHHILPEDIDNDNKQKFRNFMEAVLNRFSRPLLIKNLAFGMQLKLIKELFPEAKILYIKRDKFFNAQSLYLAYKKFNIPSDKLWSIRPPGYDQLLNLPLPEKVAGQMFFLEKEIEANLPLFGDNVVILQYEELLKKAVQIIKYIKDFLGVEYRLPLEQELIIYNANKIKLSPSEQELIKKAISEYYG